MLTKFTNVWIHYEFELIHPFADGNGRIGRLWHTLLLLKRNSIFAWLPIESIIHDNQREYYNSINISNAHGQSTAFIEFMLPVIKQALHEAEPPKKTVEPNKNDIRVDKIYEFLKAEKYITNSDVQRLFGISAATATRILTRFAKEGKLKRIRIGSFWGYEK